MGYCEKLGRYEVLFESKHISIWSTCYRGNSRTEAENCKNKMIKDGYKIDFIDWETVTK